MFTLLHFDSCNSYVDLPLFFPPSFMTKQPEDMWHFVLLPWQTSQRRQMWLLFQKIREWEAQNAAPQAPKLNGELLICLHEKPSLAGERWSLWFRLLDSEMPHACKRSNHFLPTRLDMLAGGMKHAHKLILKCLHPLWQASLNGRTLTLKRLISELIKNLLEDLLPFRKINMFVCYFRPVLVSWTWCSEKPIFSDVVWWSLY